MSHTIILLVALWIAFFVFHSWAASDTAKRWARRTFPNLFPRYRLLYNIIATITVLPAAAIAVFSPSPYLWQWEGIAQWVSWLIAVLCLYGFVASARHYDMSVFLGLTANEESHAGVPEESFTLSPFHRLVRHPWYFLGLVLIWVQDMSLHWFISCLLMSLYFWLGSILEEQKLIKLYGKNYRDYQSKVPRLIPLPWKILSAEDASKLTHR